MNNKTPDHHRQAPQFYGFGPPQWDNFPAELCTRPQWVLWRWEKRKGKWTKPPVQPNGEPAKSHDKNPPELPLAQDTWSPFDYAQTAFATAADNGLKIAGVGFVLTAEDPLCGFDFDHCVANGAITDPRVAEYVTRLDSYTEITPSGTGLRVFVKAKLPAKGRKKGNLECYDSQRYLTITGDVWPPGSPPKPIADRQAEVEAVHAEIFRTKSGAAPRSRAGKPSLNVTDEELLAHARKANNGAKFTALYDHGDDSAYGSKSEADASLCALLAFWTRRSPADMDRLFRASALMRKKWLRTDYRERTIQFAIANCAEVYEPGSPPPQPNGAAGEATPSELWNELAVTERLLERHHSDLLWCAGPDWFMWDGRRWQRDETERVLGLAAEVVRGFYAEAAERLLAAGHVGTKHEREQLEHDAAARLSLARQMSRRTPLEG